MVVASPLQKLDISIVEKERLTNLKIIIILSVLPIRLKIKKEDKIQKLHM